MSVGASHTTATVAFPGVPATFRGAEGAALIAALEDAEEAAELPARLVAITLNV